VILQPPPPKAEEEPEPEPDEVDGQIVDVAPPIKEERPKDADYLAEHDQVVPEEMRSERYKVNPEVIAPAYSKEARLETEELVDLNVTEPSTGATVGHDAFDPGKDGLLASLPTPWTLTNRDGIEAPTVSSHADATLSGAPSNDLLDEKRGPITALNTKEFLYAAYLNRIRRLVSFYWSQNLDNLPNSVILARPKYTTQVQVVLNSSGGVEVVEVGTTSGSGELDDCVVRAFHIAGPFPNPPDGLVDADGRARLPDMGFTVTLGRAQNVYQGIDPRAGVQFPGILKAPR